MCGILLEVVASVDRGEEEETAAASLGQPTENLLRRGPDHMGHVSTSITCDSHRHDVSLKASVLQMRSSSTPQPLQLQPATSTSTNAAAAADDKATLHFCWNGEVYQRLTKGSRMMNNNSRKEKYPSEEVDAEDEDGDNHQICDGGNAVLETVASYGVADTQLVADGLLESHNKIVTDFEGNVTTDEFMEAYASALADVFGSLVNAEYAFCLVTPWAVYYGRDPQGRRSLLHCWCGDETRMLTNESASENIPRSWKLASVTEKQPQQHPIQEQWESSPGNTATNLLGWTEVVPGTIHEYRFRTGHALSSTPIVVPRVTMQPLDPVVLSLNAAIKNTIPENTSASMWKASLALEHLLRQAVRLRVCGDHHSAAHTTSTTPISSRIAVLFSGGIDSVVLAALTLQIIPPEEPLYLWNVSFVDHHHSSSGGSEKLDSDTRTTPKPTAAKDCLAAQASYEELKELFPNHQIRMETTEVSWEEMTQWEVHIRTLIHPKTTTMDLNIAMALWFASRGNQHKRNTDTVPAAAEPRILLVGMGADEQLGGYGRHRKAYERSNINNGGQRVDTSLRQELDLDIERLWERNLGRDDRIFSDHSKEARFPYLDFHVMQFLKQTPLEDVCDFLLPPGEGDKRILRLLAMRLGLKTASGMVKRAIQFGSRIAHVSDKRRFGSRRKAQGTAVV